MSFFNKVPLTKLWKKYQDSSFSMIQSVDWIENRCSDTRRDSAMLNAIPIEIWLISPWFPLIWKLRFQVTSVDLFSYRRRLSTLHSKKKTQKKMHVKASNESIGTHQYSVMNEQFGQSPSECRSDDATSPRIHFPCGRRGIRAVAGRQRHLGGAPQVFAPNSIHPRRIHLPNRPIESKSRKVLKVGFYKDEIR